MIRKNAIYGWIKKTYNQNKLKKVVTIHPEKFNGESVLISYLTTQYLDDLNPFTHIHTNLLECHTIVSYFIHKGYSVDIINWFNTDFIPQKNYYAFFDIHNNLERIGNYCGKNTKKILYATTAHWLFNNHAEYQRLVELKNRRNVCLIPRRNLLPTMSPEFADYIIVLGKQSAYNSYQHTGKRIYSIDLFSLFNDKTNTKQKDFSKIKRNFLWVGNGGLVHKGLDLVIDTFSELQDFQLFICGDIKTENDFYSAYLKELNQFPNIHNYGWVDMHSDKFNQIVNQVIGLIFPSCSEGQTGSAITCMHAGLIPVLSYECGIDITECGILLKKSSINEIKKAVIQLSVTDDEKIKMLASNARNKIISDHNYDKYKKTMYKIFDEIIAD